MTRKVAVVGSSNFVVTPSIGAEIVDLLRTLPEDVVILTRESGDVDRFLMAAAPLINLRCFGYPSKGGPSAWQRDVDLVRDSDEVICLISRADLEAKKMSGTTHLLEKALQQGKPARLFTEVDGTLVGVAEQDGEVAGE